MKTADIADALVMAHFSPRSGHAHRMIRKQLGCDHYLALAHRISDPRAPTSALLTTLPAASIPLIGSAGLFEFPLFIAARQEAVDRPRRARAIVSSEQLVSHALGAATWGNPSVGIHDGMGQIARSDRLETAVVACNREGTIPRSESVRLVSDAMMIFAHALGRATRVYKEDLIAEGLNEGEIDIVVGEATMPNGAHPMPYLSAILREDRERIRRRRQYLRRKAVTERNMAPLVQLTREYVRQSIRYGRL